MHELDLQRAERAHYELQSKLYMPHRRKLGAATLFLSDAFSEPEWNHVALIDVSEEEVDRFLDTAQHAFQGTGLPPTVAVGPGSRPTDLAQLLESKGYYRSFRHTWLFDPGGPKPLDRPAISEFQIRRVETEDEMRCFLDIYDTVFEKGSLTSECRKSLASSRNRPGVIHLLATLTGAPAGIASWIHQDGIHQDGIHQDGIRQDGIYQNGIHQNGVAGLYNLAVLPSFRRRGLGRELTCHRIAEARKLGCSLIFLQTEDNAVEHWQKRSGLIRGCTVEGWTDGL